MKENLTQIVFILDRSGSMEDLTDDTIGGFNSFIVEQKKQEGEAILTTVLFDDKYEVLHDAVSIKDVKLLTSKDYFARGSTALLDAVGMTISRVGQKLSDMKEEARPSKVIVVITTDGMENNSHEFSKQQIQAMIEHQTNKYSWQFLFLGANIDSVSTAQNLGISADFASNYNADSAGTGRMYESLSRSVGTFRREGRVDSNWSEGIEEEPKEKSK